MTDMVNHPSHYVEGRSIEPIDVIADWNLGFCLGNALKYISRVGRKGDDEGDLRKAAWYIKRHLTEGVKHVPKGGIRVGDLVRATEVDDTPMLVSGQEYIVAGVNRGEVKTFICLAGAPARYWEVERFEVIEHAS